MDEKPQCRQFWFTTREIFLLILVVAIAIAWWLDHARLVQKHPIQYIHPQSLSAIRIGMNQADVRAQLGYPHNVGEFDGLDVWHYFHGPSIQVIFDKTGRVQGTGLVK
jgi:outer membrane protein assembly factor BamE (lipoprotein component of BamABCDE complex)